MKRIIALVGLLIILISGCSTVDTVALPNREHLLNLSVGMDKTEALAIMGNNKVVIHPDPVTSYTINNPYRSETLQGKDKTFEVYYYVTENEYDDYNVHDNDLTPLVFEDGKLIGWGKDFLSELKADNKIKTSDKTDKSKSKSGDFGFGKKKKKS